MNRSDFSLVIANPSLLKNSDINNLNSITDEFPYFQAARVLHLKGLKNNESFMMACYLKKQNKKTTKQTKKQGKLLFKVRPRMEKCNSPTSCISLLKW